MDLVELAAEEDSVELDILFDIFDLFSCCQTDYT